MGPIRRQRVDPSSRVSWGLLSPDKRKIEYTSEGLDGKKLRNFRAGLGLTKETTTENTKMAKVILSYKKVVDKEVLSRA